MEETFVNYYASIANMKTRSKDKSALEPRYEYFDGKRTHRKKMNFLQVCEFTKKHVEKGLFEVFVKALEECDATKILEIAEAVRFFKTNRYPFHQDADPERYWLLWAKERLGDDEKWTIRQIAEFLAGERVETPADGFSSLRRKCREIGFPIAESRKISRK
jgi:hypothetical protein